MLRNDAAREAGQRVAGGLVGEFLAGNPKHSAAIPADPHRTTSDLVIEHQRGRTLSTSLIKHLRHQGVPAAAFHSDAGGRWSLLTIRLVVPLDGHRFGFAEEADGPALAAVLWPILAPNDRFGERPLDLAAWFPRTGWAGTLLGHGIDGLGELTPLYDGVGVFAFLNPLTWLRAGRRGLLAIDPDTAGSVIAAADVPIVVDTAALAHRLSAHVPAASIHLPRGARHDA